MIGFFWFLSLYYTKAISGTKIEIAVFLMNIN